MQKWQNLGAGPIQCKRFNEALRKIKWEANTHVELTGIIGKDERRAVLTTMCGSGGRADVVKAQERLGDLFAWTVTRENVNQIIEAAEAGLAELQQNRPVEDNRKTPEAVAEQAADAVACGADR